jgi:sec-independent protein translocase protein TatB
MFDIGWSELLIIGIVALIVIGPKELPAVLRTVGQYMTKVRRMASEFQGQFQEAMREAEMADLKKQVDEMTSTAQDLTHYDPMADLSFDDKPKDATPAPENASAAAPEVASPEAAAANVPAAPEDASIPRPQAARADADLEPEAPQPKAGSGA